MIQCSLGQDSLGNYHDILDLYHGTDAEEDMSSVFLFVLCC